MHIKKKLFVLTGTIGALLLVGNCSNSPVNPQSQHNGVLDQQNLTLGKKLENPYSVNSMKRARDSLVARGELGKSVVSDSELIATHYYIRFKPHNDKQVNLLKKDTSLVLWNYPLDYEILEGSTSYHDPEIPVGEPGYQYTAVSIEQSLPDVEYEILEELILEPEPQEISLGKKRLSDYSLIEKEALRITGNLPKNLVGMTKKMSSWRPSGNIQVYDEILNRNVPVVSVNVRTKNWFKWWDGYTDINGNFNCPKEYYGDIAYSLRWQYPDNRFDIRDGAFGQAYFNGPNQSTSAWNLVISSNMSWVFARVFRAGAYYVGQEPFNLSDPPFELISVCVFEGNSPAPESGHYDHANQDIVMHRNNPSGHPYSSIELFSTATHEFGHAQQDHIYTGGSVFANVELRILDSWAAAVSYYLTSSNYNLPINSSNYWYTKQDFVSSSSTSYTPLMIDLIDNYNQSTRNSSYLNDAVSGYTLNQIQEIIKKAGCKTVNDFKNEIKALPLPIGVSATDRDAYLNQY